MFVEVTRLLTVLLLTAAGYYVGRDLDMGAQFAGVAGILGCLTGYLAGGLLGRMLQRAAGVAERTVDRVPLPTLLAGVVGGGVGALIGLTLAVPVVVFVRPEVALPVGALAMWACMYLGFRVAGHRSDELFALVGLSTRPLVQAQRFEDSDGFLVDTSAVMDGQLLPLARSGLFRDDLMVPAFVLDELQGMADAGDDRSRRARRGLETLETLRREAPNRVYVLDDEVPEVKEVDAKLVKLARKLQIRLLTNDINLAKVAEVQGVPTVIPRRLASELAPAVVAGETIEVALTRTGRHEGQGVGFLDDGSMVVVNGGADLVDAGPLQLVVSSIVPTAAGQLVFARMPPPPSETTETCDQETPSEPASVRQT
ncbi:MAG TPA: PIN domain-containing protein [Acidimicrobiia bacterium]